MFFIEKSCLILMIFLCFSCEKEEQYPLPIADFYAEIKSCTNDSCMVIFYDNSVNVESRMWDFGNGFTSSHKKDSTFFLKEHPYTVRLSIRNIHGLEVQEVKMIEI